MTSREVVIRREKRDDPTAIELFFRGVRIGSLPIASTVGAPDVARTIQVITAHHKPGTSVERLSE